MISEFFKGFIGGFTDFFKGFSSFANPLNKKESSKNMNPPDLMGPFSSEKEKKKTLF